MKIFIAALLLACSAVNSFSFDLASLRAASVNGAELSVPAPVAKEWTIIALLNGKNNLSSAAMEDVNEMETVGSTDKVNVVVELGTAQAREGKPAKYSVKRYLVGKDNDISKVTSRPLQTLDGADMGSWEHLAQFIAWAKANYPAKRYMVVVWNHGTGWKSFGKPVAGGPVAGQKGISYDDETGNHITAVEMARALERSGKAHLFASDACLMQELATNYEIRDHADVIVGSEDTEPNAGQDYARFLSALAAKPAADAAEAARFYVRAYAAYYTEHGKETTISAVKAASFGGLASRVTALADALLADGDMQFAKDSRRATVKFTDPDARDLGHFAKIVAGASRNPAVKAAAGELHAFILGEVVIEQAVTFYRQGKSAGGPYRGKSYEPSSARDFSNATGLATYLPVVYMPEENYDQLSFARNSSWTELIKRMRSSQSDDDYWDDYPED